MRCAVRSVMIACGLLFARCISDLMALSSETAAVQGWRRTLWANIHRGYRLFLSMPRSFMRNSQVPSHQSCGRVCMRRAPSLSFDCATPSLLAKRPDCARQTASNSPRPCVERHYPRGRAAESYRSCEDRERERESGLRAPHPCMCRVSTIITCHTSHINQAPKTIRATLDLASGIRSKRVLRVD